MSKRSHRSLAQRLQAALRIVALNLEVLHDQGLKRLHCRAESCRCSSRIWPSGYFIDTQACMAATARRG